MLDTFDPATIIAVESLKLKVRNLEGILINFVGVTKDADGNLRYGKQETPTPSPEPEPETPVETEIV